MKIINRYVKNTNYKKCSSSFCFLFHAHQSEDKMPGPRHDRVVSNSVLQRTVLITNFSVLSFWKLPEAFPKTRTFNILTFLVILIS